MDNGGTAASVVSLKGPIGSAWVTDAKEVARPRTAIHSFRDQLRTNLETKKQFYQHQKLHSQETTGETKATLCCRKLYSPFSKASRRFPYAIALYKDLHTAALN